MYKMLTHSIQLTLQANKKYQTNGQERYHSRFLHLRPSSVQIEHLFCDEIVVVGFVLGQRCLYQAAAQNGITKPYGIINQRSAVQIN